MMVARFLRFSRTYASRLHVLRLHFVGAFAFILLLALAAESGPAGTLHAATPFPTPVASLMVKPRGQIAPLLPDISPEGPVPTSPWETIPAPTETPTSTSTPVDTPTPTPTPSETPTPPPTGPPPQVFISEFLANPDAVNDSEGEWIELYNGDSMAINLNGWRLADLDSIGYTIDDDVWIQPGEYLVLGVNNDLTANGGVNVAYVYSYNSVKLANGDDEILIFAPGDVEVDRVVWGIEGVPSVTKGASLERIGFAGGDSWVTANVPWPGSAGDFGSPGQAYAPPPTPEPTATPIPIPPTATPTPVATPGPPPKVFISEFLADPDAVDDNEGEWIEIYNAESWTVNLRGWYLSDFGSDSHLIDADVWLQPGEYAVLARNGERSSNGGVVPLYVYQGVSLGNGSDEIRLLAPGGVPVDQVTWGDDGLSVTSGASLERIGFGPDDGWMTASTPWPGSAGDLGSPGQPYVPPPSTFTPTPGSTMTSVPLPTAILVTPEPTSEPTVPPIVGPPPQVFISEFLANPDAVNDSAGEWVELFNGDDAAVNLRGWRMADLGSDSHTLADDLIIAPGGYAVIARNEDRATNGGVDVAYVYSSISLANGDDELLLLAPGGVEVDRVIWGDGDLSTTKGASLERTGFTAGDGWVTAQTPWPGSAGDFGSPGQAYVEPPPTATPTPGPTATSVPLPTATPVTPEPTSEPTVPPIVGPPPRVFISEFLANPDAVNDSDGEWIELYNADGAAVNLRGWRIADLGSDGHTIAADLVIGPGGYTVIARNGDRAANGGVDVAYVYSSISLANGDDEILLLAPGDVEVDRVIWGNDELSTTKGASLERTGFAAGDGWATAQTPWPGSAGDFGSPGQAYVPGPDLPTPTPTGASTPTPGPTEAPTVPPIVGPPPRVFISEFLANPDAVNDSDGEWIELYNADDAAVNLRGWRIADLGSDGHTIAADLVVEPGGYAVIARNGDYAANGGVSVAYVYSSISLANGDDELLLLAPGDLEVDRVVWGDGGLSTTKGASLERTGFAPDDGWVTAQTPWPGSAGDLGSPGQAYAGSGTPVPTAFVSPTPDASPTASPTISPTTTPPPAGDVWSPSPAPSPLRIDEVAFKSADEEFIVLRNVGDAPLGLDGWRVGDAERPGDGEGMYALPGDATLAPGASFVIARDGAAFRATFARAADAQFEESGDPAPVLERLPGLASGKWALNDGGDEVALLNPAGELADAVAYGDGDYAALDLTGPLRPPAGFSLQDAPGQVSAMDTDDQRQRWLFAPPDPFVSVVLPASLVHDNPALDDGMVAVWGSLGARSNFSQGFTAPPAYLLAAAAAEGLDFLALADDNQVTAAPGGPALTLPAWRWNGSDGEEAIVYAPRATQATNARELQLWLGEASAYAQWLTEPAPDNWPVIAASGDDVYAPGELQPLIDAWVGRDYPLLPAGDANPSLPGRLSLYPRYTGLVVQSRDVFGLTTALIERRGWLTSRPGIWLALRAEMEDGLVRWMGSAIPPANEVTLDIRYGDTAGDVAGLTLWQNDQPIQQLDVPPADGHWRVRTAAIPGARLFVVATQTDGDFAVTAPIFVRPGVAGQVRISEIMPAPQLDYNGDGVVDNDDEFIELENLDPGPASLAGWQLSDRRGDETPGRRYTFGGGAFIGGGQRLVIWRSESRLNMNNQDDYVRLLDPEGREVDAVGWSVAPGGSIGRDEESGDWQHDTVPTPGEINLGMHGTGKHPVETIDPGEGQASGSPGSLTMAKRQGLERWVEFRGVVIAPPGLFNASMYVADPAGDGVTGGLGVRVYLRHGQLPPLAEGDWVLVRGVTKSFRGEMEIRLDDPAQVWRIEGGAPLAPLLVTIAEIGESLEGRLVRFSGVVSGWQGDSIYLADPDRPDVEPVRVTVRSSLGWKRPYVEKGERFIVTGVVGQFAKEKPWNGGYRVLVRYEDDLTKIEN